MEKEDKILKEIEELKDMIENLRAIVVALAGDRVNHL